MDKSHRQRMFRLHREVQAVIGGRADCIALSWGTEGAVVVRLRIGRGFVYHTFDTTGDHDTLAAAIVEWVHAESPRTS